MTTTVAVRLRDGSKQVHHLSNSEQMSLEDIRAFIQSEIPDATVILIHAQ